MANINDYEQLLVWQKAHELVLLTYKLTAGFPNEEKFGLMSQMRRAAVSVTSNIVEGFARKTVKESLHFYNIAKGSLEELRYQHRVAFDLGYIDDQYQEALKIYKLTSVCLLRWVQSQKRHV